MTLTLDIPPDTEANKLLQAAIALYDAQIVTQGQAAQMAGLTRAAFIEALGRAGVPVFHYDSAEELLAEAGIAHPAPILQ
ncbi:MAG: UPF0175 family protein [Armatimonadota bacterium]|nr:UPF0175 family protein [Armatimonadota bacterium]